MAAGPAKKLAGKEGKLYATFGDGDPVMLLNIADISIDVTVDEIDASDHDSNGWKDKLGGMKDWSGTADVVYKTTQATRTSLFSALNSDEDVVLEFRPIDAVDEENLVGTCRITGYSHKSPNNDAQKVSIKLSGRGPLTPGTIAAAA